MKDRASFRITPLRRGCRFSVVYRKSAAGAVAAANALGWADNGADYRDHRPSEARIDARICRYTEDWSTVAFVDKTGVHPRPLEQVRSVAVLRDLIRRKEAEIEEYRVILEQLARTMTAVAGEANAE